MKFPCLSTFHQTRLYINGATSIKIKTSVSVCSTDGPELPPLLILKRKMMLSDKISSEIFIHIYAKGCRNENGMKLWLQKFAHLNQSNIQEMSKILHYKKRPLWVCPVLLDHYI
jgi:hypothetical protein